MQNNHFWDKKRCMIVEKIAHSAANMTEYIYMRSFDQILCLKLALKGCQSYFAGHLSRSYGKFIALHLSRTYAILTSS